LTRTITVPFDYQPILRGDLVTLRPLLPSDHDALYSVAADPLIWEQHPDKTRCQAAGFRVFFEDALASGGALIASETSTQRVIGSSRFHAYDEHRSEVEIGWTFLARACWGGRYNGEMKRLMLRHAFRFVRRVIFLVDSGNIRSQQAVVRIGAVQAGLRRDGTGRERLVFAITDAGS
jgi:RimJ/RimL family protein N-acetyltransferase